MQTKRQSIIVWFQHRKNIKHIKKHGNIIYVSTKLRYAILYVDQAEIDVIAERLLKLPFISKTDKSQRPFISTDYENAKPDKAKMYDYKMGI